jgi:predicted RNA polymerase sigma factor
MSVDTSLRTITLPKGDVVYDSDMPMGALRGINRGAADGNLDDVVKALATFIVSWPFKGEPTDPDAWDLLRRSEFSNLIKSVMEDINEAGE